MKVLSGTIVIFASTLCVNAYIEETPTGRSSSPFPTTEWSPKSFAPKIRIRPMDETAIRDDKIQVDLSTNGIIRREYGAWTKRYGKTRSNKRFEIFKQNFEEQMEMNRRNGEFFLLNEFGDLTKEEYISLLQTSKTTYESKEPKEQENERRHTKPKITPLSDQTLPAAPPKQLEELTQEVIDSVMESSRKYVEEELQTTRKSMKVKSNKNEYTIPIHPQTYVSERAYTSLIGAVQRATQGKETMAAENSNLSASRWDLLPVSYIDFLYTPMKPLDNFITRSALESAAILSSSETIHNHLIETQDCDWHSWLTLYSALCVGS